MKLAYRHKLTASIICSVNVYTALSFTLFPITTVRPRPERIKEKIHPPSFRPFGDKLPMTSGSTGINASTHEIDFQSDETKYGRGDMHLSAVLDERDIVVYQTGTWEVDGVEVGDGSPATYNYCIVDTIQLVWTHNCEHGFIRGMSVSIDSDIGKVEINSPLEFVDFGPEQLVARLPVQWINENEAQLLVKLPKSLQ